jgi:putative endonuclease
MDRIALGKYTESLACKHLQDHGLSHRESNYRCKLGEIDLIMQDGQTLVFVEVRYRESAAYGNAAESVNRFKQQKLLRCANHYLSVNHQHRSPCRFDVVSLNGPLNQLVVDWIPAAFIQPAN